MNTKIEYHMNYLDRNLADMDVEQSGKAYVKWYNKAIYNMLKINYHVKKCNTASKTIIQKKLGALIDRHPKQYDVAHRGFVASKNILNNPE